MNERKTEDLIDGLLRAKGYYAAASEIVVEKQKSDSPRIQKLLEYASKRGPGSGKPEFIIRSPVHPDFIIIVECKANPQRHVSATRDRYADFAVDGALLYASYLAKEFDVLAIGASGQDKSSLRISHHFHLHGDQKATDFPTAQR